MELRIVDQKENHLLKRKEVTFVVEHPRAPTPKAADVRAKLAATANGAEDLTILKNFVTSYGSHESRGTARIYHDRKSMEVAEPRKIVNKRFGIKEEPKPAAEAAAAPAK